MIEDEKVAQYLEAVFLSDSDMTLGDVRSAPWYDAEPFFTRDPQEGTVLGDGFQADVTVIVSPGRSIGPVRHMVQGAKEKICIEAMSMDMDWMRASGLLDDLLSAARSGVEVKILLDRANQYEENMAAAIELLEIAKGLPVECKLASAYHEFSTVHNKGMIIDDDVLVSSINLGVYAFSENREMGVIIGSETISDSFYDLFLSDWLDDGEAPTIMLSSTRLVCEGGEGVIIDAGSSYDNSAVVNYSWDIRGDGSIDGYGPVLSFTPDPGVTIVWLTISDGYGNSASETITITAASSGGPPLSDAILIAPAAAIASVLTIKALRKRIKSNQ